MWVVGTSSYSNFLKNLHSLARTKIIVVVGLTASSALGAASLYSALSAGPEATSQPKYHFFTALGADLSKDTQDFYDPVTLQASALKANDSASVSSQSSAQTNVQVNGQSIAVPNNGQIHKVIKQEGGQTIVDINTQNSNSSYSTNIDINSTSSSHGQ